MDNRYFTQAVEYKYCYDCKYYRGGNVCDLFQIKLAHNMERHHMCVFHDKIKGGNT